MTYDLPYLHLHVVFSESFESKLQALYPFTPELQYAFP